MNQNRLTIPIIPRLCENAKHLSLEAVNTEPLGASYFRKIKLIRYTKKVAVIVAHPDDETLWAGGTLLGHPLWTIYIVGLCRGKDAERSEKFFRALKYYNAKGILGDLNDGPFLERGSATRIT